jgi:glycosyltransferase involved in cell wall biosynthesis
MKILFIVPGSGDPFYCGNCFRDNQQANALRKAGHDVVVMPLYLPLKHDSFTGDTPLFFPAVSMFVARKYFTKKTMPRWIERLLNSDWSLGQAASFSGSTSSEGLEDMTLSMINGDDRIFRKYAGEIVGWLKNNDRPDIIHLSSSLLIGIAKVIKQEMNIPVVCSLQDEEVWIDALGEYAGAAWQGIRDNAGCVDRFIASSEFYRQTVLKRTSRINAVDVVYPGFDISKYYSDSLPVDPTIGFFYRMNRLNGLHILAAAFVKMKKDDRVPRLRLRIGGGFSGTDKAFLKSVKKTLSDFDDFVDCSETYSLNEHAEFYRKTTVISVPITFDEGTGLYVCEAYAAGRPVVEPSTGSFPEIVSDGGELYPENTADALANALTTILTNKKLYDMRRQNAIRLSLERYSHDALTKNLLKVYSLLGS